MDLQLADKAVLVTASSMGIGRAIAEAFIKEGCRVAISSRNKEELIKTSNEIKSSFGEETPWYICDINSEKEIIDTYDAVQNALGKIDILVNNCGGPVPGDFDSLSDEDWQVAFEHVLLSAVRFSRLVLPGMKERRWGRIINITSISVKQPIENLMLSNSLRSGVVGFTKTLSNEVGKYNITVNNVAPGYTMTHRLYELAVMKAKESGGSHEQVFAELAKETPLNRLARPDEIANAVVFLASEQASYITGHTLPVDGGRYKGL